MEATPNERWSAMVCSTDEYLAQLTDIRPRCCRMVIKSPTLYLLFHEVEEGRGNPPQEFFVVVEQG